MNRFNHLRRDKAIGRQLRKSDAIKMLQSLVGGTKTNASALLSGIPTEESGDTLQLVVTTHRHSCAQLYEYFTVGQKKRICERVWNCYFTEKPWPTPVERDRLHPMYMGCCENGQSDHVIDSGRVYRYNGVGWTFQGYAEELDYYRWPTVEETKK